MIRLTTASTVSVLCFTEGRRVYGNNLTAKRLKNNVNAYAETLQKVLDTFYNNPQTITEMKNAMIKNFGWDVEDGRCISIQSAAFRSSVKICLAGNRSNINL